MKRIIYYLSLFFLLISCKHIHIEPDHNSEKTTLAFPKAVGFGVNTLAGNYGEIIRVTNLNAEGPGSLKEAMEKNVPRLIVFEVGGVIDMEKQMINVENPFVTIAGQTAPSPGITVIKGGILIKTHDVLIQHLRIRPGDAGLQTAGTWEPDGISIAGKDAYNVVIDHCSISWSIDENIGISGPRDKGYDNTARNITISNCIIAEALMNATHIKGNHSMGMLVHDFCTNIAVINNIFSNNDRRNPYFKANTTGVVVNNLIYNPGEHAVFFNYVNEEFKGSGISPQNATVSVVGNVLMGGYDTYDNISLIQSKGNLYVEDNIANNKEGNPVKLFAGSIQLLDKKPSWPGNLSPYSSEDTFDRLILDAGARPLDRDDVDNRIISDILNGTGKIIDSQEEVGGYPSYEKTEHILEIPEQDIVEWLATLSANL